MLALELNKSAVKSFMGQILREDIFDKFEVRSVEIATNIRINIDGLYEPEGDQKSGFATWEALRPMVYSIIKTSLKPRYVKIVFSYKANEACDVHANAAALFLNMAYQDDNVLFTTGTSQREFILDKSLDANWDEWVRGFFVQIGLLVADRV